MNTELWNKLDAAQMEKKGSSLIPEGDYTAVATEVVVKEDTFPEAINFTIEFSITEPEEFTNRKCWFNGRIDDESSEKKINFYKSTICKLAGVSSTDGNPMETLVGAKGNTVSIAIKHTPGYKDPSKTYQNIYVNEKLS